MRKTAPTPVNNEAIIIIDLLRSGFQLTPEILEVG